MGTKLLSLKDDLVLGRRNFGFFEDFLEFVTGDLFTDTSGDSGAAVANVDAAGGAVTLTTGATDNNECYLLTTKELFLFADAKPLLAEARFKYTEGATDDANVMFGFMNAVGADSLVDDGVGPKTTFSGAGFYKVDGGLVWHAITSVGTTRTDTTLSAANALDGLVHTPGGGAYQTFRIECDPYSSTNMGVAFWIDDILVAKIDQVYTSATEMMLFIGNKAGGSTTEVLTADYLAAYQLR